MRRLTYDQILMYWRKMTGKRKQRKSKRGLVRLPAADAYKYAQAIKARKGIT